MSIEKIKSLLLVVLITFGIIFFSVRSCQKQEVKQEDHSFEYEQAIANGKKREIDLTNQGEALKEKIKQDSIKSNKSLTALKIENKELRKKIIPVRKELQPVVDSLEIVRRFVGLTDSLDVVQEATIDTLSAEKVRTWRSFNTLIANKDDQIQVQKELNAHFVELNSSLYSKVRKERNKKTFWKVATGIAVTGLIFQSFNR